MYVSTKTYGPEAGFAVAYRQWRADSHCNLIHGYDLMFKFTFESEELDVRNWVVDYGSLKSLKNQLVEWFDHTLIIPTDDPEIETFRMLHNKKLCKLVEFEKVGCEGLSEALYAYVNEIWLPDNGYNHVHCRSVEVAETGANRAWYECHSAEHDELMKTEISRLNYMPKESITDFVGHVNEMLSYVKRIKLRRNKPTVYNEFLNYCVRVAPLASTPEETNRIIQLKNSL